MNIHFNWRQAIAIAVKVALRANPVTAPIADEGSALAVEAEELFAPSSPDDKTGKAKLQHVLNGVREAAQAVDELQGSPDELAGHVTNALEMAIKAANEARAAASVQHQPV